MKIKVKTYGSINKAEGWNSMDINLDKNIITVEDVLHSIKLKDGITMLELIADKNGLKEGYTILLDGLPLWDAEDIRKIISQDADLTVMDVLHVVGGG